MKHTEFRAAVLDALEKHDTGATLFDGRPAVFDEADFPAIRRQLVLPTRANYTGRTLQCDIKSRLLLPSLSFSCSFHLSV
ncbi:phage minor tail U family protein, partial [Escherichia coli]|uniref:phage minor tail U family protein n=1 Tax=Escherichia coli TaxID=562 RepID=UPI00207D69A2